MLSIRQRNQIKAALTFWNAVAETSRVHPMEHPHVRAFFQGDSTPLIAGEIDDLIVFYNMECDQEKSIVTLSYMIRSLQQPGLTKARLKLQAKRDNVEPVTIHGGPSRYYNPTDLIPCARKIKERDAQMMKKYHATKTPPTDSD